MEVRNSWWRALPGTARVLLAILAATLAAAAWSQPQAAVRADREALEAWVAKEGAARLIVGLAMPAPAVGEGPQVPDDNRRRTISDRQSKVLARVGGNGLTDIRRFRSVPFVVVESTSTGLARLLADPGVASIEEDRRLEAHLTDTPAIVHADTVWAAQVRGAGQTVAILDTGVDAGHPFFAGKIAAEACFSTGGGGYTSLCPNGGSSQTGSGAGTYCPDLNIGCYHGTHVAGIVAGKQDVLAGGSGIAPDSLVMPVQVFARTCGANGCAIGASLGDLVAAMEWVYDQRNAFSIAAVNMSLGSGGYTSQCDALSPLMTSAVELLRSANIATVVSSGNSGYVDKIGFPACISGAVSVGATTKGDQVASFSNAAPFLSLLAPGQSILSAYPGGGFVSLSGTSMAAPHVAGAWALLKSARPISAVSEVLAALRDTGAPLTDYRQGLVKPLIQIGDHGGVQGALSALLGPGQTGVNHALQSSGAVASASSTHSAGYPVAAVNNGDRTGASWGSGGGWNDASRNVYPDWVQIDFNGAKSIGEIGVFTLQDSYGAPVAPIETMTFSLYGITAFTVQYWTGSAWATVPGGGVSGNNKVWRRIQFTPVTTTKVRVLVNASLGGYSRITEIEAWGAAGVPNQPPTVALVSPVAGANFTAPATVNLNADASDPDGSIAKVEFFAGATKVGESSVSPYALVWGNVPAGSYTLTAVAWDNVGATTPSAPVTISVTASAAVNHALAAQGGTASSSSTHSAAYPVAAINNGDRTGAGWGAGGGWNDATRDTFPDWVQIDFSGSRSIGEVGVFTLQDNFASPATPTSDMLFSLYGVTAFEVQYWTGAAWAAVPGGAVTGNSMVWRRIQFPAITTQKIRVRVNAGLRGYSRIVEVEAWSAP